MSDRKQWSADIDRIANEFYQKTAMHDRSWSDYDRNAPKTPWGPAQYGYKVIPGVWLFGTAGHGGIMVSLPVARKYLSGAAVKMGMKWGGALWYEEDELFAIPIYEHPEWLDVLVRKQAMGRMTPEQLEAFVKREFPQYLMMKARGETIPRLPKFGDWFEFTVPVRFSGGLMFNPGDRGQVTDVTRSSVLFTPERNPIVQARLSISYFLEGKVKVVG